MLVDILDFVLSMYIKRFITVEKIECGVMFVPLLSCCAVKRLNYIVFLSNCHKNSMEPFWQVRKGRMNTYKCFKVNLAAYPVMIQGQLFIVKYKSGTFYLVRAPVHEQALEPPFMSS